ncbi:MAG: AraC family transcriptional regulator [Sphaerochaetaceae bacterium]|nr:AraC family transcriptional regulator [Sphaerochaetaceae bacterium]MDC7237423.1 AraC family transcriptional regulator [Sphaerochaetaceae bacterium]
MECSKAIQYIIDNNLKEGFNNTFIEGVRIFKNNHSIKRQLLDYKPGILIVLNGTKHGYLANHHFEYSRNYYIVLPTHLQFECEAVASNEDPVFGLHIELDIPLLNELILKMNIRESVVNVNSFKVNPSKIDKKIEDASLRLLEALENETDSLIIGPSIVKEIMYLALQGANKPILYALCAKDSDYDRLSKALRIIHTNYKDHISVEYLAKECSMSESGFYKIFKSLTGETPLQYLKKIRLTKAKDILSTQNLKACNVASLIGYESVSQFSREFKRHYGFTPGMVKGQPL